MFSNQIQGYEKDIVKLFDFSPDLCGIFRVADGKILVVNRSFCQLFEYEEQELLGKTSTELDLYYYKDRDRFSETLKRDKQLTNYEVRVQTKSGKILTLIVAAFFIEYKNEQCISFQAHDITERKAIEEKLRLKNRELERAQEIAKIGSWYLDLKTNEVSWTEELYKIYGFDPLKPVPPYTEHMKLFTKESWELLSKSLQNTVDTGEPYELELRTVRKDEANGWMWVRGEQVKDNNNNVIGLWGAAQDITEQKRWKKELINAREKAEESENKFKAAFYTSPDSVIISTFNGEYVEINESFTRISGYAETEVIGKTSSEINIWAVPEDRNTFVETLRKNDYIENFESLFRTKNGTIVPALVSARIIMHKNEPFILSVTRIITERKKYETELLNAKRIAEESKANITAIIEGTNHSIWAFNRNYQILYINHIFQEEFLKSFGVLLEPGMSVVEALPESLRPLWKPRYDRVLANEQYTVEDAVPIDNDTVYIEVSFNPIVKNGEVIGGSCFGSNITSRKQGEIELIKAKVKAEESQKQFMALFEQSPLSIQIFNINGIAINVNRAWRKLWQVPIDYQEINKYNLFEDKHAKERGWLNYLVKAFEGETVHIPALEYNPQENGNLGRKRILQATAFPIIINKKVENVVLIHQDVTDLKKYEADLIEAKEKAEESEERFTLAMNAAKDGLYDWNLVTNEIYYSPGWKSMLGYKDEELPNDFSVWEKLTEPHDVQKSWELQQQLINKQRDRFEMEFKMKHKDGHWVDILSRADAVFNEDGKAIRMVGTHIDISERKRAQEKIQIAEENLKNTFNLSPSIISKVNLNTGYFLEASSAVTRILGYTIEEFTSKPIWEFIHPDDKEKTDVVVATRISGNDITYFENRYLCKNGSYKWMAWHGRHGDKDGIVTTIGSDITERKQAEIELIKAKEKAEESDRLKSAFLANMSHEIRTPMNGILGFSNLLNEPGLESEEQQAYIKIIQKSGARMLNILSEIVAISKIESGAVDLQIKQVNINKKMESVYELLKPDATAKSINFSLKNNLRLREPILNTDESKLDSILTNLVKNAIKYTDEGYVEFGYNPKEINGKTFLEFYVKDTGLGIRKDRKDAIFERFIQADIEDVGARQGAGLGLTIVKSYVELLGGKVWVESEMGIGSTFYFTLPYNTNPKEKSVDKNDLPSEKDSTQINPELSELKILIADDDETSLIYLSTIIKDITNNVLVASSGIETVKICQSNSDINLVLMDIQMPEMNGYEATKQIREFNNDVIIIAQTAFAMAGDREKSIAAGCNDYISKPIKKDKLLSLIQKHFNK